MTLDELLDQLQFEEIDSQELLYKIIFSDPYHIDILRSNLKNSFVDPLYSKVTELYKKIADDVKQNSSKEKISEMSDPLGLLDINQKSKNRIQSEIIDPVLENLEKTYNKIAENAERDLQETVDTNLKNFGDINISGDKTTISDVKQLADDDTLDYDGFLESIKISFMSVNDNLSKNFGELIASSAITRNVLESYFTQKTDAPDFSETDNKYLSDIFKNLSETLGNIFENIKPSFESEKSSKSSETESEKSPRGGQKSLEDEPELVSLSDESMKKISDVIKNLSDFYKSNSEELLDGIVKNSSRSNIDVKDDTSWLTGAIKAAVTLLGVGGLMVFAEPIWNNYLQPWIKENFGLNFKQWDDMIGRFGQLWDGISKWFVMGGTGMAGVALRMTGQIFDSFGSFLSKNIDNFFSFLGKGGVGTTVTTAAKWFSGGSLAKIAGNTLGTMSKLALKSIPFIGSLFSFKFAYDDYNKGDIIGMSLNIASGIVNLFGPIGWGLSFGIDVLSAILEIKSGGDSDPNQQTNKTNILKDWANGVGKLIKKIPVFEWFYDIGEGLNQLINGNVSGALNYLGKVPVLGTVSEILRAVYESSGSNNESGQIFDFSKFGKQFKSRMEKHLVHWIPSIGGLRKYMAGWLGITDYENDEDPLESAFSEVNTKELEKSKLLASINNMIAKIASLENQLSDVLDPASEEFAEKEKELAELKKELASRKDIKFETTDSGQMIAVDTKTIPTKRGRDPKLKKANDVFIPSDNASKIIYDPSTNTEYSLAREDNIMAFKDGGELGELLNSIRLIIIKMSNEIKNLKSGESSNISSVNNNVNVNNSNASENFAGGRDPIYNGRNEWWYMSTNERILI